MMTKVLCATRLAKAGIALILGVVWGTSGAAPSDVADALRDLNQAQAIERTVRLSDLGFNAPLKLQGAYAHQDVFFPIPKNKRVRDAQLRIEGEYTRLDAPETHTRWALAVNGGPRAVEVLEGPSGLITQDLALQPDEATGGFVHLATSWQSVSSHAVCSEHDLIGEGLSISPASSLSYRLDKGDITTVADAYAALSWNPSVVVAAGRLEDKTFDTAWRVGALLERQGRRVRIQALPKVGEAIDVSTLDIPEGLQGHPVFASLMRSELTVQEPAQIAALLLLGWKGVAADVIIVDAAWHEQITQAFDDLLAQLPDDDSKATVKAWQQQALPVQTLKDQEVALLAHGGQPVIALAPGAAPQFTRLIEREWPALLGSGRIGMHHVSARAASKQKRMLLPGLADAPHNLDVRTRAQWQQSLALTDLVNEHGVASRLIMDVAAAPGAGRSRPVASVYWNDVLLGARQLRADGKPERLSMRIPAYALGVDNALRVQFQRQAVDGGCTETPQAYPAAVLPTSQIVLKPTQATAGFVGVLPLMAQAPRLLVPQSWQDEGSAALRRVMVVANAGGLSLGDTQLRWVDPNEAVDVDGPFVALDVTPAGVQAKAAKDDQGHIRIHNQNDDLLDLEHTKIAATAEVVKAGGHLGVLWQSMDDTGSWPSKRFSLHRGDLVLLSEQGPVAWMDSRQPPRLGVQTPAQTAFNEWRHAASWLVWLTLLAGVAMLLLLFAAYRARRRRKKSA